MTLLYMSAGVPSPVTRLHDQKQRNISDIEGGCLEHPRQFLGVQWHHTP